MNFTLELVSLETLLTGHNIKAADRDMLKEQTGTDTMKTKNDRTAVYSGAWSAASGRRCRRRLESVKFDELDPIQVHCDVPRLRLPLLLPSLFLPE